MPLYLVTEDDHRLLQRFLAMARVQDAGDISKATRPWESAAIDEFQPPLFLAKTTAEHASGATQAVDLYGQPGEALGSETKVTTTDGDVEVQVHNRGETIGNDKFVICGAVASGGFEVIYSPTCAPQNAIMDITVNGSPTGGTFDMNLTVGGSEETLTFNYNDAAAAVDTELDTHTEIANGDVSVTGGPFPDATIRIEFIVNLAETNIALPTLDWGSLTGGSGVSVIAALAQLGIA